MRATAGTAISCDDALAGQHQTPGAEADAKHARGDARQAKSKAPSGIDLADKLGVVPQSQQVEIEQNRIEADI